MSWQLLGRSAFDHAAITDLRVNPANADEIVAGSMFANAGRITQSSQPLPLTGVFKSSDGGANWSRTLPGECLDLETHPTDFSRQYAAIGIRRQSSATAFEKGIWRSLDGGITWAKLTGPWSNSADNDLGRGEMAISPSNPNVLYVSIAWQGSPFTGGLLGIWRTDNAWDPVPIWTAMETVQYCGSTCSNSNDLLVDPTNPGLLYAGGDGVYTISASTWSRTDFGLEHQHALAFAGSRLIAGGDRGVFSSISPFNGVLDNNANLSLTQFYQGSIHPGGGRLMLGGTDSLGSVKWTGTNAWTQQLDWYGADNAISPTSPDTHQAVSQPGSYIYRSLDGSSWSLAVTGIPTATGGGVLEHFAICPHNENVVVAGSFRVLWRSNDFFSAPSAPTWTQNSPQWAGFINQVAFDSSDTTCSRYALAASNLLRLTTDGGATWTDLDVANAVPNRMVTDLAFDPRDANVLYVSLEGFDAVFPTQPGHVFKTTNALSGAPAWTDVSPPEDSPFNALVLDPLAPDTVYAGGDFGLWKSPDGGASWSRVGSESGLPTGARIFDLEAGAQSGRLAAFTHGRGAYLLTVLGQCPGGTEPDLDQDGVGDSCDNCPSTSNANQSNADGDAYGDACDVCVNDPLNDADGDGLCASVDTCPSDPPLLGLDADHNGCTDTIAGLAAIVKGLHLSSQTEKGLLAKLTESQKALNRGNEGSAINALHDFINQVNAKRGNGISSANADFLILYANNLIQIISA